MPPCMGFKNSPNVAGSFSSPTNSQYTYGKELYGWPQSFELPCYDNTGFEDPLNHWLPTDFDYGNQYQSDLSSPISGYGSGIDTSPLPSWSSIQNSPSPPKSAELISPPTSPQQQLCRVCNDIATGNHFGVLSCEACKSFFRRSIRAGARYTCRGSKCCDIDKSTRNRCQHCRLQKCFDAGLNKNGKDIDCNLSLKSFYGVFFSTAVQEERMPYPTKRCRVSPECSASPEQTSPTTTTGVPFPFYVLGPTPIHMVNMDVKSQALSTSMMLEMLLKANRAESNIYTAPVSPGTMQDSTKRSLLGVIAWAKELPMFTRLPIEDQIELIKKSWNELNTLKLVYRIAKFPSEGDFCFQTCDMYPADNPVMTSFIQNVTKECTATIQDLQLDETELSFLKLVSLMNPCKF